MSNEHDFSEIAPFEDSQFAEKLAKLVKEPGFRHAVNYVAPEMDYDEFSARLCKITDKQTFQTKIMWPFLEHLASKTTSGITVDGLENVEPGQSYTFITNHRDIVLDASFLNLCFLRSARPTSEVAIGDNLLIYEWITDLVKLNKSFVVKRNLRITQALEAARELSAYIHYAIGTKHESVWIAQREGRAKDSNDMTQESLVKMFALAGGGTVASNVAAINLMPVAISYEYDPNDYLKAKEFLLKRNNPDFRKSPHDDLLSMETGMLSFKGHVHFGIGRCINPRLEEMMDATDRNAVVRKVCSIIDESIHASYMIYPVNYVAYDMLHGEYSCSAHYTPQQAEEFRNYIEGQLDKVALPDISADDRDYMRTMMLTMYANPLRNKRKAHRSLGLPDEC